MSESFFTGACTALVTPLLDGKINYPMMQQLLRRQYDAGIRSVVVCGTTGESATLTDEEKLELVHRSKEYVRDRMQIIAGTGSNSTEHTVCLSKEAERCGADGLLVVSPYYNKATPEGLIAHYMCVAEAVSIPLILYNVPSRTGLDIPVSVYKALSHIENIAGVKEATTDITKIGKILSACGRNFSVWSGNDDMTVPIIALGGKGVISVASNVMPELTNAMVHSALDGDFDTAAAINTKLQPLHAALFREVNPIPVKRAMSIVGYDCGNCRLPLTEASEGTADALRSAISGIKF